MNTIKVMTVAGLDEITPELVRSWYTWLDDEGDGCSSLCFATMLAYEYYVAMGWHRCDDGVWRIAWKIGRQRFDNVLRADFDVDFESLNKPEVVESGRWDELAASIREEARRVKQEYMEKEMVKTEDET